MIKFTAMDYIDDVLSGRQIAGKWVRLACERHLRDLETGHERGLYFDEEAAKTVIAFFSLLKHSKGEWAGQPVTLEPWQQFHFWTLFGWKREDGSRRFRTSYLEVARKNGKSLMASGTGLYMLVADGEGGAEVYTAATKLDQARIVHSEAIRMVQQSSMLSDTLSVFKNNISYDKTFAKYEPLGSDSDTLDGLNPHGAMIDEVHAHKTPALWEVIEQGMGARRQPLMYAITTAGYNRQSLCWELHEYTEKVLEGVIPAAESDQFYGVIYCLDQADNWEDESVWVKANPNLGVSKKMEMIREQAEKARAIPSRLNSFLRYHLSVWTQAETRWVDFEAWKLCGGTVRESDLVGRACFGGLDLSSKTDLTALVWVFPPAQPGQRYEILCRFWVPEEKILSRSRDDRVPYDAWVRQGWIEATPGPVVDYDFIIEQVRQDMSLFQVDRIAFDPWNANNTATRLTNEGVMMVEHRQGYRSMSEPMKETERLILSHQLNHGDNPVLTWMAHNLVSREDPAGNIKPDKEKSREKIDGMVALIMAIDWAYVRNTGRRGSVYEERGVRTL